MAFDLSRKIPSELAHRHEQRLLVHKERNDGGGKRTNVQGRPLDGTEIAKRSGFIQGHDGEFTFMVKHGLPMETSEAPRIFSWAFDKTFKRWKMSHQTPPSMMFTALRGSTVDGSWSGLRVHQR